MAIIWSKQFTFNPDTSAYIESVKAKDESDSLLLVSENII